MPPHRVTNDVSWANAQLAHETSGIRGELSNAVGARRFCGLPVAVDFIIDFHIVYGCPQS